ncbi:RagB/SusD family nutrient uptake outer membrane protein [Mariniphaga sediminis]|uniref:RagB/SusD family nutrient uptake outer membrane protein n=1 Tax=Mariniphaga sediminis TaxID=1628158 RepID=A0A399D2A2_9BACT|nr:RagB/SusD family nutrient uptake outer membrane protein [Mariniphaga sediminis]RIH64812.1 RagB/SusD family nutrient uptake outer membrane protein [Mariniphaga sediminis]
MKKIILSIIIAAFLVSCQENLLETIPDDRISTEIYWHTEDDAITGANALYPTLDGNKLFAYDGITDVFHTNRLFENNSIIEAGNSDATFSRYLDEWDDAYTAIQRANYFFENIDGVETDNAQLISQLKGEVRTIRAFHYMKLVMLYGDVPLVTTNISAEEGKTITRDPVSTIWDFVSQELTTAAGELPTTQTGNNTGRVIKGAALGLKARAMLYAGRYSESAAAAKQVMDLGVYSLHNSYEDLFQYAGENCSEVILDHQYAKDVYSNNYYNTLGPWSLVPGSVGSVYVPTKKLVDMYDMTNGLPITDPESGFDPYNPYENRDPRLKQSIFVTGMVLPNGLIYNSIPGDPDATDPVGGTLYTTTTGWNVKKYISDDDMTTPGNSGINLILLRYAEVLLTYAEAKIELNEIDNSVYDAINEVRTRVSVEMPPIGQNFTQEQLRQLVRKERTIELAFEGTRLFDLRRWRIAHIVMPEDVYGMTYDDNGTLVTLEITGYNRVFNENRDYLWPIPQKERELSPNLVQNPNW